MKKVLLLTVIMVFSASIASAQLGVVGAYSDPAGTDCNIVDAAPGLLAIYIVHTMTNGVSAVQYSAPQASCQTGSWLSDTKPFDVTVGDSQAGVAIGYGGCLSGAVNTLIVQYFADGGTPPCCEYPILPDPTLGTILVADCAAVEFPINAAPNATINGDVTCDCAVPVEESTWGAVKQLFNTQ